MPQIIAPIVIMSAFSTLLLAAFGSVLVVRLKISPFTIPFVLSTWLWLLAANSSFTYFPVNGGIVNPHLNQNKIDFPDIPRLEYDTVEVIAAIFKGVGQVYF